MTAEPDRGRILDHLGLAGAPSCDLDGLTVLYTAWCRGVPFDNLRKRVALASAATGPLPGIDPGDFFAAWLADGAGGTCWPSNEALCWLLDSCGFAVQRVAATMFPGPDVEGPNHGSAIVTLDGVDHLVDSSMLFEVPLPLRPGVGAVVGDGVVGAAAEVTESGGWRIWHDHWRSTGPTPCSLDAWPVERAVCHDRYEHSRGTGPFNVSIRARRNTATELLNLRGLALWVVDRATADASSFLLSPAERAELLVDRFGYSQELVASLPPDVDSGAAA